jgi:hypothetical protein
VSFWKLLGIIGAVAAVALTCVVIIVTSPTDVQVSASQPPVYVNQKSFNF